MNTYCPPHIHSHYSLLDGLSQPKQIIERLDKLNLNSCAITEHNNLSSSVEFFKKMKDADKKPILGIEFSVCNKISTDQTLENKQLFHQLFYANKQKGWKDLLKLTYYSNQPESFYYKPRLSLTEIAQLNLTNLITATGHLGSTLASIIIREEKIQPNWLADGVRFVNQLKDIFGKDNVLLEVQLVDSRINPLVKQLVECIREIATQTNTKTIASTDAHYCEQEQSIDQQILLCASMNTTLAKATQTGMSFFSSNNYHIPSYEEMLDYGNTEEELENTKLLEECSDYSILSRPVLPAADFPKEYGSADEYMRNLCRDGWKKKIANKIPKDKQQIYADRIKEELTVLQSVKLGKQTLSDYFLIIKDIVNFCKNKGWPQGVGRGSAAGSLCSYLLDLTKVDPIKYGLIFSRFYNTGRNTKDRISLPDFDLDSLSIARPQIIEYIKSKYGHDKVTQICTFGKLKGRSAIKTVFRAHNDLSFNVLNELTKQFPEENKIVAELKEMDESSIIMYTLKHDKKGLLKDYCYIKDDKLQGPLSKRFEQAIRIEDTIYSRGIHPAGVVILPTSLEETLPVVYDAKNKKIVCGLSMDDVEHMGGVKFDILAISLLDKVFGVQQILTSGKIDDEK